MSCFGQKYDEKFDNNLCVDENTDIMRQFGHYQL
jgi:hypothetical protein